MHLPLWFTQTDKHLIRQTKWCLINCLRRPKFWRTKLYSDTNRELGLFFKMIHQYRILSLVLSSIKVTGSIFIINIISIYLVHYNIIYIYIPSLQWFPQPTSTCGFEVAAHSTLGGAWRSRWDNRDMVWNCPCKQSKSGICSVIPIDEWSCKDMQHRFWLLNKFNQDHF